jgi:hypothetical protein
MNPIPMQLRDDPKEGVSLFRDKLIKMQPFCCPFCKEKRNQSMWLREVLKVGPDLCPSPVNGDSPFLDVSSLSINSLCCLPEKWQLHSL